jgi:hypothetical protein
VGLDRPAASARLLIRNFRPEEREADRMHQTSPAVSMAVSLGMGIVECAVAWGVGAAARWLVLST